MKKSLLAGILLAGSFLLFNNDASAAEANTSSVQPPESMENVIYFNSDTQDILITDDFIITTVNESDSSLPVRPLLNGKWDPLGSETVFSKSSVYYSDGGSFMVDVSQTDYGPVFYQLKEYDETNADDSVGSPISVSGKKSINLTYRDLSRYCDGDNGKAEFYMEKLTHTSSGYLMAFYD